MDSESSFFVHSCAHCRQWFLNFNHTDEQHQRIWAEKIPLVLKRPNLRIAPKAKEMIGTAFLNKTMDQVIAAAKEGCHMAQQLTGLTVEANIKMIEETSQLAGQYSTFACYIWDQLCTFAALQLMYSTENGLEWQYYFLGEPDKYWHIIARSADDPSAAEFRTTLPNLFPDSDESFNKYRGWMESCQRDHESCFSQHQQMMPKRLIDVSESTLRLVETHTTTLKYAALSYAWGGPQPLHASRASLTSLMTGIQIENLPPTLQDAVIVAQKLDLAYLWIDALCIVQDDEIEKGVEVSRMGEIYENASVTIASSRTKGVTESFLRPRREFGGRRFDDSSNPALFGFDYLCKDGRLGSVLLTHKYKPAKEPLSTRAWAFQEHILSPRILDFGSEQTRWICCQKEELRDGWVHDTIGIDRSVTEAIHSSIRPRDISHYTWRYLLSKYAARDITRKEDRLPAISAIAKHWAGFLEAKYLAGLWEPWIKSELLWRQDEKITDSKRPMSYLGPSWSWAGIDAHSLVHPGYDYPDSLVWINELQVGEMFRFIGSDIIPLVDGANYGEVQPGAHLVIRGKLRPAILSCDWENAKECWITAPRVPLVTTTYDLTSRLLNRGPSNNQILPRNIYMDCLGDDLQRFGQFYAPPRWPEMQVFLLTIPADMLQDNGLILVKQSSGDYFRVGTYCHWFFRDPDYFPEDTHAEWEARKREHLIWLRSGEPQTFKLV